ncbi:MAG: S-layer family protein [Geitlerinemataceae cyanobacterium]
MQQNARLAWIVLGLSVGGWGLSPSANGQILPDTTLPINSIVTPQNNTFQIDGGTAAGGNLFHSFQDFSLPTGSEAFFNNTLTVDNIITRVTGGNISNIDGLIRANGMANLFFINPNGIVFGANAKLEIGGSFLGSTADRVLFADGSFFSATDTGATAPLLTVNVPIGLQFGAQPGGIRVEGAGSNLLKPQGAPFERDRRTVGLQVRPEQTLALVGGNLELVGGNLTAAGDVTPTGEKMGSGMAPGGRIELGSVAGNNTVSLTPISEGWALGYEAVQDFQDIHLTGVPAPRVYQVEGSSLDVSGSRAGTIQIRGRSIFIRDGSALLALTLGKESAPGDAISVQAENLLEVSGSAEPKDTSRNAPYEVFPSTISAEVWSDASGQGRNISIETPYLEVADKAFISARTGGMGDGGNLAITATQVNLIGASLSVNSSIEGSGNGGDISISTDRLIIDKRGAIEVSTLSDSDAGTLTVNARESIELSDRSAIRATSTVNFQTINLEDLPKGNGGEILLQTGSLRVLSGANIAATTLTAGDAGNLTINADYIELIGVARDEQDKPIERLPSRLEVQVNPTATGNGGDLAIHTHRLAILDGARISGVTQSRGRAGNLTVEADEIEISGATGNTPSQSIAAAEKPGTQFIRRFPELEAYRTGSPGNMTIEADRLLLSNGGRLSVRDERTQLGGFGGNTGNINVRVSDLQLRNRASITTQALNEFDGGNITIETDTFVLEDSRIDADAVRGSGGRVNIFTRGLFANQNIDQAITANSRLGIDGVVTIQTPDIDPSSGLNPLPEIPIDAPSLLGKDACSGGADSKFVYPGSGGLPPTPSEELRGAESSAELVPFPPGWESDAQEENGTPEPVLEQPDRPLVEAQGWFIDDRGRVILTANPSVVTPQGSVEARSSCRFP